MVEALQPEAQKVIKQYEDGLHYKKRMNFLAKWAECERFKAGDQWPNATEKTKNLPRPVFNIIELIEAHKVATVMSEQIKMVYSTLEDDSQYIDAADTFTRFSETHWENIKQDQLNEEALDCAANIGTAVWHYYWDHSIKGGNKTAYQGELVGEIIDPVNIFFGNPQQKKVQKQPYIIITSRELVESVRKEAKENGVSDEMVLQIKGDKETLDQSYDMAQFELDDSDKVTVITKYWKENGTVHFMKVASGIVIKKKTNTHLSLYPIAAMQWKKRKKSIYGVSETETLIPNQKTINFLMAMQTLSVQLMGFPKMVYKKGSVDPTKITNTPGEMIQDNSPPGQVGIHYLNPAPMTNLSQVLVDKFVDYTRQMTGANDSATGNQPSADLNATAIMLLQKASGVPIESIKRRFYQAMEDIGRIWEDFWKVKYNITRPIKVKDDDGNEITKDFNGNDYKDIKMNLKIDIGPSSSYSESLMMSSLDRFLDRGDITFQQYLKYAPKNVVPFRDRLLKEIEEQMNQQPPLPQGNPPMGNMAPPGAVSPPSGMMPPPSPEQINQILSQLPPDLQQQFMSAPPEIQMQMLQDIMATMPPPQQPPMMG